MPDAFCGLNFVFPSQTSMLKLYSIPNMKVFKDGAFWRYEKHESRGFMKGICNLIKRDMRRTQ